MIERQASSQTSSPRRGRANQLPAIGPITVRPATMSDLPLIVELRLALVREHTNNPIYARLRPDAPDRARRLFAAQLRSPDEVIFLAEYNNEAAGILRCLQAGGLPLLFPPSHGYIPRRSTSCPTPAGAACSAHCSMPPLPGAPNAA